jgi:hypothetical protein
MEVDDAVLSQVLTSLPALQEVSCAFDGGGESEVTATQPLCF